MRWDVAKAMPVGCDDATIVEMPVARAAAGVPYGPTT